ncbi:hypothetical protein CG51_18165 [Haematobacter missouriensis]|uniref:DUF2513 domain-containing protein n=1 Tax=Haematobacter missouriensis TaxID=366616 RepID=A0A212AHC2_9RHOB|nr:hypothetical protein [Haematobacter missouriensis]KFI24376.1 hypothetical protein CG51_18165 [Haematobacter missouriensis]OWJ71001.1 hypothetical protein CDV53_19845 [Haematobacter missouriensis]OWJ80815.1 hypothetical protein CDV52_20980 [Haematobacter missouriensis]
MEDPENIARFKDMAGRLLGALYATHPESQFADASLIFGDDEPSGADQNLFDDTVGYLVENGYLTSIPPQDIRLNDRSFDVLQKPNPITPQESIGSSLATWAADTTSEIGRGVAAQAAGAALSLLYSVIKSG